VNRVDPTGHVATGTEGFTIKWASGWNLFSASVNAMATLTGDQNLNNIVSVFSLFILATKNETKPELGLESQKEGLTAAAKNKAQLTKKEIEEAKIKQGIQETVSGDLVVNSNNNPTVVMKTVTEDVSDLTTGQIEKNIQSTYGQAALDVVKETIGEHDLKEYMNQNGIKNINDLAVHMKNLYGNDDTRRTLIADLGVRKYESTVTPQTPLGNGLEAMGYVADTAWFLAGGNKTQFADDFGFAFNADVNSWLPGGESKNNQKWNVNQRIINEAPNGWAARYGGLPSTGFKPELVDGLISTYDQTHHFSGVFWMTAHFSSTNGNAESFWLEVGNGFKNMNDQRLGFLAVDAYNDPMFWKSPSTWIRYNLGK
jgi:hypothetical protein